MAAWCLWDFTVFGVVRNRAAMLKKSDGPGHEEGRRYCTTWWPERLEHAYSGGVASLGGCTDVFQRNVLASGGGDPRRSA
jgi:hypothetical protein